MSLLRLLPPWSCHAGRTEGVRPCPHCGRVIQASSELWAKHLKMMSVDSHARMSPSRRRQNPASGRSVGNGPSVVGPEWCPPIGPRTRQSSR